MLITSVNNEKIKELLKYYDKSKRELDNKFIVEGIHLVEEALKKDLVVEVYLLEGSNLKYNCKTYYVSDNVMKKISKLKSYSEVVALCKIVKDNTITNKILALDNIQDPGNLGTIIRSACAFNFNTILLSCDSVDLYNDKVIRSTKGMLFHTNIITCNLEEYISKLKDIGYDIITTNVNDGIDIKSYKLKDKLVLIIGNEGHGIRESISSFSTTKVYINMNDNCESLNASIAASILMYEVNKK